MPIGVRAAKRGLPPIPAFGIGWLYPVCPRRANLAITPPFFIPPGRRARYGHRRPGHRRPRRLWARQFAASLIPGLPLDSVFPITFSALAMLAVALLAAWLPARRAARVDPVNSLRYE